MNWIKAISQDELPANTRKVVKLEEKAVLLVNHNDKIYAVENSCPHLKLPMRKGKITDDNAIVCPFHRSAFDLETGELKEWTPFPPGVGKLMGMMSQQKPLGVFPTRIDEGSIWVAMGS